MIAVIFAWLSHNWQPVLIWSVVVVALLCSAAGLYLSWRRRQVQASE